MSGAITPARAVAYEVLRQTFEHDGFTEIELRERADAAGLEGRERAQAQHLAFGSVQHRGTCDALVAEFTSRRGTRPEPVAMAALRLGIFELLFSDGSADHAAVDQAVSLTREAGAAHAAGFVNALLRRALRERERIERRLADDSTPGAAAFAHSAPAWLVEMWWQELGPERARSVLASINRPSERCLRVNPARASREQAIETLGGDGLELQLPDGEWPMAADELLVARGGSSATERAVADGFVVPQSRGSAAVVEVLDPRPGERVLDLCAGPGIKTGQIAARVGRDGDVISIEKDERRAEETSEQAERLGLHNVTVIEADAAEAEMPPEFDRVLLDAPCSDLGALASRPDARWRKSPKAIARMQDLQARLLKSAAASLRPGGALVYSTCTISRRENSAQVAGLAGRVDLEVEDLGERAPGLRDPGDQRLLQILPDRDHTTGFFIARMSRPG